jgi:predicted Zn-dependent protease
MRPAPRSLLALCGVAVLLAACESAPVTGRSQMMLVSESEELRMGLQAYQQVLSKEPLSYDAETNALVEKVGRRIAAAAERPPNDLWRAPRFRWEFKTVDKNEPNAFCLPGGKVVVYTGILPITKTEAGLAVVIGHEVAHALARHGAERMSAGIGGRSHRPRADGAGRLRPARSHRRLGAHACCQHRAPPGRVAEHASCGHHATRRHSPVASRSHEVLSAP